MESVAVYLCRSLLAGALQILVLVGPGFALTLILHFVTRFVQNRAVATLGQGWYLGLFGWLGTVVHELGHALFCLVFLHKITEIQLFRPDPESGTLGYVKHSYNPKNIYHLAGNFFIGIGPILSGIAVVSLSAYGLLGINPLDMTGTAVPLYSWDSFLIMMRNIWNSSVDLMMEIFSRESFSAWQFWVFIYLVLSVGSSITLSPADIKVALGGFLVIIVLVFFLNLITLWAGDYISDFISGVAGYNSLFYAAAFLILIINAAMALLILWPLSLIKKSRVPSRVSG